MHHHLCPTDSSRSTRIPPGQPGFLQVNPSSSRSTPVPPGQPRFLQVNPGSSRSTPVPPGQPRFLQVNTGSSRSIQVLRSTMLAMLYIANEFWFSLVCSSDLDCGPTLSESNNHVIDLCTDADILWQFHDESKSCCHLKTVSLSYSAIQFQLQVCFNTFLFLFTIISQRNKVTNKQTQIQTKTNKTTPCSCCQYYVINLFSYIFISLLTYLQLNKEYLQTQWETYTVWAPPHFSDCVSGFNQLTISFTDTTNTST